MESSYISRRASELREYAIQKLKEKFGALAENTSEVRTFCVAVTSIAENFPLQVTEKHIDKMLQYNLNGEKNQFFAGDCSKKGQRIFAKQDDEIKNSLYSFVHGLLHKLSSKDVEYRYLEPSYSYNSDVDFVAKSYKCQPRSEETNSFTKTLHNCLNNGSVNLPNEMKKGLIFACEGGFCLGTLKYDGSDLVSVKSEMFDSICFGYEGVTEYLTQQVVLSPECKQNAQVFGVDLPSQARWERFGVEAGFMYILNCVYDGDFQRMFFDGLNYAQNVPNLNNEDLMGYIYYCNKWTNSLNADDADEDKRELFLNGLANYTESCLNFINYNDLSASEIYRIERSLESMYLASGYNKRLNEVLRNFVLSHYYDDDVEKLLEEKGLNAHFLDSDFAERALDLIFSSNLNFDNEIVNGNINELTRQAQNREDIDGWLGFTKKQLKRINRDTKDYFKLLNYAKFYAEKRGDKQTAIKIADKIALDTEKSFETLFKTIAQKIKIYDSNRLKYSYYDEILGSMLDFLKKKSKFEFKEELHDFINKKHQDILILKSVLKDNALEDTLALIYDDGVKQDGSYTIQEALIKLCVKLENEDANPFTSEIVAKIESGVVAMNVAKKAAILNSISKQSKKAKR